MVPVPQLRGARRVRAGVRPGRLGARHDPGRVQLHLSGASGARIPATLLRPHAPRPLRRLAARDDRSSVAAVEHILHHLLN
eukprot:4085147-Prymnesium_polylepis.1